MHFSVAVVIPTQNRLQDLRHALASIAAQTIKPKQIIVIDDGSDEPISPAIFAQQPDSIECLLVRNEQCRGGNYSRNLGIVLASTEWISFLDDDDTFLPEKFDVIFRAIQTQTFSVDVVYHPAYMNYVNESLNYISRPCGSIDIKKILVNNAIGGTSMVVVRKQALLEVGQFDEQLLSMQDYDLWIRLILNGKSFLRLDEPLTNYRIVSGRSFVSASIEKHEQSFKYISNKYETQLCQLSFLLRRKRDACFLANKALKFLMSDSRGGAASSYLMAFFKFPRFSYLIAAIVSLFGFSVLVKLKSKVEG